MDLTCIQVMGRRSIQYCKPPKPKREATAPPIISLQRHFSTWRSGVIAGAAASDIGEAGALGRVWFQEARSPSFSRAPGGCAWLAKIRHCKKLEGAVFFGRLLSGAAPRRPTSFACSHFSESLLQAPGAPALTRYGRFGLRCSLSVSPLPLTPGRPSRLAPRLSIENNLFIPSPRLAFQRKRRSAGGLGRRAGVDSRSNRFFHHCRG